MFTDIVGYSAMANKDQKHALELLSTHDSIIEPIISQYEGKVIKKIGDSIFAEFPNPQASIQAAQEVQTQLTTRNAVCNTIDQIQIRIGLHYGEVIRKEGDLFGHDVNLCSRIESVAPGGGIAASSELIQSLPEVTEIPTREMGYVKLKNITHPQQIYKIYSNPKEYETESDKQLQKYLRDNGIDILDMDTYSIEETFSAAVLYINNLGSDEDESIAYGLTEDLIHDLAYINNLRAPDFNEILHYKNSELGRDDIGRQLQVDNILQGSILKENNTLKLSFEMLDINQGKVLWNESWTDHISNNKNIRSHILQAVLSHFSLEVPQQLSDSLSEELSNNPDAIKAYNMGRYYLEGFLEKRKDLDKAKVHLEKALELDPQFAEAYYMLGVAYQRLGNYDEAETALSEGEEIAEDKKNLRGLSHIYRGFKILYIHWGKYSKAKRYIEKALKIEMHLQNSTFEAQLRIDYANCLNKLVKTDFSIEQNNQAIELLKSLENERLLGIAYSNLNDIYLVKGDYTQSILWGKKALAIFRKLEITNNTAVILIWLAESYQRTGRYEEMNSHIMEAEKIISGLNDYFREAKIYFFKAQYALHQKNFSEAISQIDNSIDKFNLAKNTRWETEILIEKLNILLEAGIKEKIDPTITMIEHLINQIKGGYSNELFQAIKYFNKSLNGSINIEELNAYRESLEEKRDFIPLKFPLTFWYLAKAYHSLSQLETAQFCHEKSRELLRLLAARISGKEDQTSFFEVYFHKRIGEKLG